MGLGSETGSSPLSCPLSCPPRIPFVQLSEETPLCYGLSLSAQCTPSLGKAEGLSGEPWSPGPIPTTPPVTLTSQGAGSVHGDPSMCQVLLDGSATLPASLK